MFVPQSIHKMVFSKDQTDDAQIHSLKKKKQKYTQEQLALQL